MVAAFRSAVLASGPRVTPSPQAASLRILTSGSSRRRRASSATTSSSRCAEIPKIAEALTCGRGSRRCGSSTQRQAGPRKIRRSFPTLAAAKAWRADALSALNRGQLRAPTRTTVAEAAQAWLAGAEDGTIRNRNGRPYKPSAIRGYRRALDKRVVPALGHLRLSEVRRIDVQDFVDRLMRDGHGESTILNTLDPLRAICCTSGAPGMPWRER